MVRLEDLMTIGDVVLAKNVSRAAVYKAIRRGTLRYVEKGDRKLIPQKDVDAWEVRRRSSELVCPLCLQKPCRCPDNRGRDGAGVKEEGGAP